MISILGQQGLQLHLNGFADQLAGALSDQFMQWIGLRGWLCNGLQCRLVHGVSSSVGCDRRGDQPTGYATLFTQRHTPEIIISLLSAGDVENPTGKLSSTVT